MSFALIQYAALRLTRILVALLWINVAMFLFAPTSSASLTYHLAISAWLLLGVIAAARRCTWLLLVWFIVQVCLATAWLFLFARALPSLVMMIANLWDNQTLSVNSKLVQSGWIALAFFCIVVLYTLFFWAALLAARLRRFILIDQAEESNFQRTEEGTSCVDEADNKSAALPPQFVYLPQQYAQATPGQPQYILVPMFETPTKQ